MITTHKKIERQTKMTPKEEKVLIDNFIQTQDFQQIYDAFSSFIYAIGLKFFKNDEYLANEIKQKTFIRIYKNIHKFQYLSSLHTWIYRIAYNVCINEYYKKRNEKNFLSFEENKERVERFIDYNQMNYINTEENYRILEKAVLLLPDFLQEIYKLFYKQNYNIESISKILSIPSGTVKSRLFSLRKKLKSINQSFNDTENQTFH